MQSVTAKLIETRCVFSDMKRLNGQTDLSLVRSSCALLAKKR